MYLDPSGIAFHNIHGTLEGATEEILCPEAIREFQEREIANLLPRGKAGEGRWLTRLPNDLRLSLNALAQMTALHSPAAELRFHLQSEQARITLRSTGGPGLVEIYQGAFYMGMQYVDDAPTPVTVSRPANLDELCSISERAGLGFDPTLTRVALPIGPALRLVGIEGSFTPPAPGETPALRMLSYGSSITHGSSACHPSGGYAMRAANLLGADLLNMGFGGGAHLEPQLADYLAARDDWDIATLELGINVLHLEVDEFARRVEYLVTRIATANPARWVFVMGVLPFYGDWRGDGKAPAFRQVVREQVARLALPRLVLVEAEELLTSPAGLTTDLVHPSQQGMEEIGAGLARRMKERMAAG